MINKISLKISEPWDFTSSDGNNILNCIIIRKILVESNEVIICKCTSVFKIGKDEIRYIGLLKRGITNDQFNIYKLMKVDNLDNDESALKKDNLEHIMVGKIKDE